MANTTTLYQIAEKVQRKLTNGQPTRDAPIVMQELILAVKDAFGIAVKANLFQNYKEGEKDVNGAFIFPFENIPVTLDTSKDLYYSDLPSTYITLPNEMGIQQISNMKSQNKAFIRVPPNFLTNNRGLKSEGLLGNIGFWAENSKIFYVNMDVTNVSQGVLIKLVAALDGIDEEDDYIDIPPDIQAEIVERVYQSYLRPQNMANDTINDNKKVIQK